MSFTFTLLSQFIELGHNPRPTDFQGLDPSDTLIVMAYRPIDDLRG